MQRSTVTFLVVSLLVSLLVSWILSRDANAQENAEGMLQLSTLIQEAVDNNPEIIAARNRWNSAQEIIEAQKALPDPEFSYGYFLKSVETRVGPQKNVFSAKQKFPFYGKRDLKGDIAAKEAEVQKAFYDAVKQEVMRQVKTSFYDLFYLSAIIDVTNEEKEILKRFERIARTKYKTGIGNQQNILKVQVEISKLDDRLLALATQKETVEAMLNRLLDRPADRPLGKPMKPKFRNFYYTEKTLVRLARENRPELKAGTAQIEKSDRNYSLAKKAYYPDLTFGVNYIQVDNGPLDVKDNGEDAFNVMVSINVPLWRSKLSSQVKSAFESIKAQKNQYQDTLNRTLFEVEDNYFKIQTARETFDLYKNVLTPQAEQSFKSAEAGYVAGITSFLDLLDAQRILLQIQFGYWKAYTDYLKRIADMERAAGIELAEEMPEIGAPEAVEE